MITLEERVQDDTAAEQLAGREQEIQSRRRDLATRLDALRRSAQTLQDKLADLAPEAEATAELTGKLEDVREDLQWIHFGAYQLVADALAVVSDEGEVLDYPYTPADIKAWCDRALELGCSHPLLLRTSAISDLLHVRQVPNAPFRERYNELLAKAEDGEGVLFRLTIAVADALKELEAQPDAPEGGYGSKHFVATTDGKPSVQHRETARMLGLVGKSNGRSQSLRLFIPYEHALAFMRALGMSPHEAGL